MIKSASNISFNDRNLDLFITTRSYLLTTSMSDEPSLATSKMRKGIPKALITHLTTKLSELEAQCHEPSTVNLTQEMPQRWDSLDEELQKHHHALFDAIEKANKWPLSEVQDELDDLITDLSMQIERLVTTCNLMEQERLHHAGWCTSNPILLRLKQLFAAWKLTQQKYTFCISTKEELGKFYCHLEVDKLETPWPL